MQNNVNSSKYGKLEIIFGSAVVGGLVCFPEQPFEAACTAVTLLSCDGLS